MERHREAEKDLAMVFVDLEKAYDRVPRDELWWSLRRNGVPAVYVDIIMDIYQDCRASVICEAGEGEGFNVGVGLHQGSALSPLLIILLLDEATKQVAKEVLWPMLFAGDLVICEDTSGELQVELERWRIAMENRGLRISRSKAQVMFCDFSSRGVQGEVRLGEDIIEEVQQFKYLGSVIHRNATMTAEVKQRTGAGWGNWKKCSGALCD